MDNTFAGMYLCDNCVYHLVYELTGVLYDAAPGETYINSVVWTSHITCNCNA
jgi:hypothetical protein